MRVSHNNKSESDIGIIGSPYTRLRIYRRIKSPEGRLRSTHHPLSPLSPTPVYIRCACSRSASYVPGQERVISSFRMSELLRRRRKIGCASGPHAIRVSHVERRAAEIYFRSAQVSREEKNTKKRIFIFQQKAFSAFEQYVHRPLGLGLCAIFFFKNLHYRGSNICICYF